MAKRLALLLLAALLLTVPARAADQPPLPTFTMTYGGLKRRVYVSAPEGGKRPRPLLLLLCARTGVDSMRWMTDGAFERLARRAGWVVAYPEPVEKVWNDGREAANLPAQLARVDDAGFLMAAADRLGRRYGADAARVYVAGFSAGGMMALRLACERPERVAAAAAVAATMPAALEARCRPRQPPPVLMMVGLADPFMHFPEGELRLGPYSQGRIVEPARAAAAWARREGCRDRARAAALPVAVPADPTRPLLTRWTRCRGGGEVAYYAVKGGGQAWPGGGEFEPPDFIGATSRNLDATRAIWDFFRRHIQR